MASTASVNAAARKLVSSTRKRNRIAERRGAPHVPASEYKRLEVELRERLARRAA